MKTNVYTALRKLADAYSQPPQGATTSTPVNTSMTPVAPQIKGQKLNSNEWAQSKQDIRTWQGADKLNPNQLKALALYRYYKGRAANTSWLKQQLAAGATASVPGALKQLSPELVELYNRPYNEEPTAPQPAPQASQA